MVTSSAKVATKGTRSRRTRTPTRITPSSVTRARGSRRRKSDCASERENSRRNSARRRSHRAKHTSADSEQLYDKSQVINTSAYGYTHHTTRTAYHAQSVLHSYAADLAPGVDDVDGPLGEDGENEFGGGEIEESKNLAGVEYSKRGTRLSTTGTPLPKGYEDSMDDFAALSTVASPITPQWHFRPVQEGGLRAQSPSIAAASPTAPQTHSRTPLASRSSASTPIVTQ